jgi:hypothetical protein
MLGTMHAYGMLIDAYISSRHPRDSEMPVEYFPAALPVYRIDMLGSLDRLLVGLHVFITYETADVYRSVASGFQILVHGIAAVGEPPSDVAITDSVDDLREALSDAAVCMILLHAAWF